MAPRPYPGPLVNPRHRRRWTVARMRALHANVVAVCRSLQATPDSSAQATEAAALLAGAEQQLSEERAAALSRAPRGGC